MTRAYTRRIEPANLRDLPSVLDTQQTANVLRVSVERVRELAKAGRLRNLAYSSDYLYDAREVLRFLEEATDA